MAGLRPYRRRRLAPVLVTVGVLAALAVGTWTVVLVQSATASGPVACNAPAAGSAGTVVDAATITAVAPAAPSAVRTTVLNAGGQRGQANLVAAQLSDLGFGQARQPDNDPLYPAGDLTCHGQLRFGQAGEAAASTLSLVMPCLELVRDGRPDATVDVSVGTTFTDVNPPRAVTDVLGKLGGGGTVDPQQITDARSTTGC